MADIPAFLPCFGDTVLPGRCYALKTLAEGNDILVKGFGNGDTSF